MRTRTTFGLMTYLKKSKSGNETIRNIYARVTVNGKFIDLSLHHSIESSKWNQKLSRSKGRSEIDKIINRSVELLETRIHSIRNELQTKGEEVTAYKIKNEYLGITPPKQTLIEEFEKHNLRQLSLVSVNECAMNKSLYQFYKLLHYLQNSLIVIKASLNPNSYAIFQSSQVPFLSPNIFFEFPLI